LSKLIPSWATKKQIEGMNQFSRIIQDYPFFNIDFQQCKDHYPKEGDTTEQFMVVVTWDRVFEDIGGLKPPVDLGAGRYDFRLAWNHEKNRDNQGMIINQWQIMVLNGLCTNELSSEVFIYMIFHYLNKNAVLQYDLNH